MSNLLAKLFGGLTQEGISLPNGDFESASQAQNTIPSMPDSGLDTPAQKSTVQKPSFAQASKSGPGGTPNALAPQLSTKGKILTTILQAAAGGLAAAGQKTVGGGFEAGSQLPFMQAQMRQQAQKGALENQALQSQAQFAPFLRQLGIQKTQGDIQKTQSDISKNNAEEARAIRQSKQPLPETPEQAVSRRQQDANKLGLEGPQRARYILTGQMSDDTGSFDRIEETSRHDRAMEDLTRRGQSLTDSRQRELNQIARDTKREQQQESGQTQLNGYNADMDRLAEAANELKNHPGLAGITGLRGALPNIPGGQAANAEAKFETLKSQTAFGVLQNLRNSSKTGGALGQISDKEEKMLASNLAALDKSQSTAELQKSLDKIINYTNSAKGRAREAFERTYGSSQSATPSKPQSQQIQEGQTATGPNGHKIRFTQGKWVDATGR